MGRKKNLFSDTHGYDHLLSFVSCIRQHIEKSIPIFEKPLEDGPAERAETKGFLIYITINEKLAAFTLSTHPDEQIIHDCIMHARSADAIYAVILSPQSHIWLRCKPCEYSTHLSEICAILQNQFPSLRIDPQLPSHDVYQILGWYVSDLRKGLNGWFYRKEGEGSETIRNQTVQALMNHVILYLISAAHTRSSTRIVEYSLKDALFAFASTVPLSDKQYMKGITISSEDYKEIIEKFAPKSSPLLDEIRLSWIEPEIWSQIFRKQVQSLEKKKKDNHQWRRYASSGGRILETPASRFLIEALYTDIDRYFPGMVYDPSAGCGEVISIVLRLIRMRSSLQGGSDSIIRRLIIAGDTIFTNESSVLCTMVLRFVLIIWVLGGDLRDQLLDQEPLWYPIQSLNSHIRVGNPLFRENLSDECSSVQEASRILRKIRPINITLEYYPLKFSLIISDPITVIPDHIPEIATYLTRHYQSYQKGIYSGCLYSEMIPDLIKPGGRGVIFLPTRWKREALFRMFRRWLKTSLPATLIEEEKEEERGGSVCFSPIILGAGDQNTLQIVRITKERDQAGYGHFRYPIQKESLSEDHGWRLDDPYETELITRIISESMPLSAYLFDEIYPGCEQRSDICPIKGWTSLTLKNGEITIDQGEKPGQMVSALIPGSDPFLLGVLYSTLMAWCIQVTSKMIESGEGAILHLIKNLPIVPIDHYNDEEVKSHRSVEELVNRLQFLTHKKERMRTWHDQKRLEYQISAVREKLDCLIFRLYKLSQHEGDEIKKRVHNRDAMRKHPPFEIFEDQF